MSADAVALFRPKTPAKLKPFLDLDDENEESDGLYAEELDDGAFLVHTFQPFEVFEQSPNEVREWLAEFGDALPEVHDDARGVLFFPDTCEPESRTYEAVVEEVGDAGVWVETAVADVDAMPSLPATSFEVGQLFQEVQNQLFDALVTQMRPTEEDEGDDEVPSEKPDMRR